jgi:hypothetical protein
VASEPFEIKTGETKSLDFSIPYSFGKTLIDQGGVLGALGAKASGFQEAYFVIVVCDVKGTAMDPKATIQMTPVD